MKKTTAVLLTLVLVLAGVSPALAAATGIQDLALTGDTNPGTVSFDLTGMFETGYDPADMSLLEYTGFDATLNGGAAPAGTVDSVGVSDAGGIPTLSFVVNAPQTMSKQPIVANFNFSFNNNSDTAKVTWTGNINPVPNGTIIGLAGGTKTISGTQTGTTGSQFSFTIDMRSKDFFKYQGNAPVDNVTNYAGVALTGTASDGTNNYTATSANGILTVKTTGNAEATNGTVTLNLPLTMTNPLDSNADKMTLSIPVNVSTPPAATITGIKDGANLTWNLSTASINAGSSFTVTVQPGDLTWSDNGSGRALTDADITTFNGFSVTLPSSDFTVGSWKAVGGNMQLTITAPSFGKTYTDFEVSVSKTGTARTPKYTTFTVNETTNTNPKITGVRHGTNLGGSIPSAMKVNESFQITFGINNFTWEADNSYRDLSDKLAVVQSYVTGLPSESYFTRSWSATKDAVTLKLTAKTAGTYDLSIRLWQSSSAYSNTLSKKVTVSAAAITGTKITGIESGASLEDNYKVNGSASSDYISDMSVKPGDIITLEFNTDFFTWDNGKPATSGLTNALLSAGKITMRESSTGPVDHIKMVHSSGKSYIEIKIDDTVTSTKDVKFSATVYFYVNGNRHSASGATVKGVVTQEPLEVYDDGEYDLTSDPVFKTEETIRNGSFYIGNDMTIHASLSKGRTYYASSNTDYTRKDEELFNKHSEIEQVLHIDQTGFPSGSKVSFDTYDKLYVYDGDGNYLGTTSDKVPLKSTYYLTNKRINFGQVVNDTSSSSMPSDPTPTTPAPGNGSGTGSGSGYNPNTGR